MFGFESESESESESQFEIGFGFGIGSGLEPVPWIAAALVMEVAPANWDLSQYPTCKEEHESTREIWAETLRL